MSQKKGVTNENHYCPADEINSDDDEINEPDLDVLRSEIMSELLDISLSSCYERSSTIKVDNESPMRYNKNTTTQKEKRKWEAEKTTMKNTKLRR